MASNGSIERRGKIVSVSSPDGFDSDGKRIKHKKTD